ncbi:hypothetical protein IWZ00DRAFT_213292 [Phyllosticta capitalensis]
MLEATFNPPPTNRGNMQPMSELFNLTRMTPLVEEVRKKSRDDARFFGADRLSRARHSHLAHDTKRPKISSTTPTAGPSKVPERFFQEKSPCVSRGSTDASKQKLSGRVLFPTVGSSVRVDKTTDRTLTSNSDQVPSFEGFVYLSKNILARNNKNVLVLPVFDNDQSDAKMNKEMEDQGFNMNNNERAREIAYVEKCWQQFSYAPEALAKAGVTATDIIHYYAMSAEDFEHTLEKNAQSLGLGPRQASAMMKWKAEARHASTPEWDKLVSALPRSEPAALARASSLRQAWSNIFETGMSLVAAKHIIISQKFEEDTGFEYRSLACRVCHMHECHLHGALIEDDDTDSTTNMRTYITTGRRGKRDGDALGHKTIHYWDRIAPKAGSSYMRPSFVPCNHAGSCEDAQCSCYRNEVTCEKSCGCSKSCQRRFSGCSCSQQRKTCWNNPKCPCFHLARECDPDVCLRCGAIELLDPVNRGCGLDDKELCQNVKIQRGSKKLTLMGTSTIEDAGFGLYAAEDIRAGDYIGEYTGELISAEEMVRREFYYERQGLKYVFNLTGENPAHDEGTVDQAIDASKMGNELRLINNASEKFANCFVRIMMCNTVYRIGVFAGEDIPSGSELFFNYGFDKTLEKDFRDPTGAIAKTAAVVRRNSVSSVYEDGVDDMPLMMRTDRGQKRKWSSWLQHEERISDDEYVDNDED